MRAVAKIDPRMLGRALRFPADHEAIFARINDDGQIELLIEGPSFPETEEGALLPSVGIVFHEAEGAQPSEFQLMARAS